MFIKYNYSKWKLSCFKVFHNNILCCCEGFCFSLLCVSHFRFMTLSNYFPYRLFIKIVGPSDKRIKNIYIFLLPFPNPPKIKCMIHIFPPISGCKLSPGCLRVWRKCQVHFPQYLLLSQWRRGLLYPYQSSGSRKEPSYPQSQHCLCSTGCLLKVPKEEEWVECIS